MEKVRLGKVCKIQGGYAFKSNQFQKNNIPIIRIGNIQENKVLIDNNICYTKAFLNNHPEFEIKNGDLLIAMSGATVGKVGIYSSKESALLNQRVGKFVITDKIECRYLYFLLISPLFEKFILNNAFGCAQPNISNSKIEEFEFYICSIETQIEIANKLEKVQKIIDLRKKQLEELEELIKSQFVEMFGGIGHYEKIGDICSIKARIGWQGLTKKEYLESGDYYLVTGTDFNGNTIDFNNCSFVTQERYNQDENIQLKEKDVLVTKDGTIGKVAFIDKLPKPATLNSGVFVVRDKLNILNPIYLEYALLSNDFSRFIRKIKTGSTIAHLNQEVFLKFRIPIPEKKLQDKFEPIVQLIDKQKFEIEKSLKETEELQKSLMYRYFGG